MRQRLVLVELKIGEFDARYEGQMKLYLEWPNRHEREDGKESPVGLILCAEGSREQVELVSASSTETRRHGSTRVGNELACQLAHLDNLLRSPHITVALKAVED